MTIARQLTAGFIWRAGQVPKGTVEITPIDTVRQPSLRDWRNRNPSPGSELPGYYRISLRKKCGAKCSRAGWKRWKPALLRVHEHRRAEGDEFEEVFGVPVGESEAAV